MSGGRFEYKQYDMFWIADDIQGIIDLNGEPDEDGYVCEYAPETIEIMNYAEKMVRLAATLAHRVDWLVSGDDCEESFHDRVAKEIEALNVRYGHGSK